MKNNLKKQKYKHIRPGKLIWGMSTQNPEEKEEEEQQQQQDASQGSQQQSCYDSSRMMDSGMVAGTTRLQNHDMPNRLQVLQEEEEEKEELVDTHGGDDSLTNVRERLKRHRTEVAGRVWIPEIWGQEEFLKDWVDCTVFDSSLVPSKIMSARVALVEESTSAYSPGLSVGNSC